MSWSARWLLHSRTISPWKWIAAGTLMALLCGSGVVWWGTQRPLHHWRLAELALERRDVIALNREIEYFQNRAGYQPHMHQLRGMVFLTDGNFEGAVNEFNAAATHEPLRIQAAVWAGEALCKAGQYPAAQQLLIGAIQVQPDHLEAHRWLAIAFYDVGAYAHALDELKIVAELAPDDPRPHRLMGLMAKDSERFEDAVADYRESLQRDPNQPQREEILLELGQSLVKLNRFTEALEVVSTAVETSDILALKAECHLSGGDTALARTLAQQALEIDPEHNGSWRLLGNLALEEKKFQEAIDAYQHAVVRLPDDFVSRGMMALVYERMGNHESAKQTQAEVDHYRALVRRFVELRLETDQQPRNAELRYQLGQTALQLSRIEPARMWFKAALSLNPRHLPARQALVQIPDETESSVP